MPRLAGLALLAVMPLAGCAPGTPLAGTVEVEPSVVPLRYPGFSEAEITWTATQPLAELEGELRASIHVVRDDEVLRTFDRTLDFEWQPGQSTTVTTMFFQSALAPPLGVGSYELRLGLYDSAGNRWELDGPGASLEVDEQGEGFPAFYFSPEWLPIEGGTDRQILGRRWLQADGAIRLGQMTRPGTLWLQLGVPTPRTGEQEMVFEGDATETQVAVVSDCGFSQTFTGIRSHEMRIPIGLDADGAMPSECEIKFDANYTLVSVEDGVRRTIALESLSWLPG